MLNYTIMRKFFEDNPKGYINLVQSDCVFKITSDIAYILDETSITLMGIYYTDKNCGNCYNRKGNFMIPFNQILRVEYIKKYIET